MAKITSETLHFLTELKSNNHKDWFTAHKNRYEMAKNEFEGFVAALLRGIAAFDPPIAHFSAKQCVFRIYRDVRFSADKSPYKTHFGAHVSPAAKKSDIHTRAGYYLHLEPGGVFLGGGAYLPESAWLRAIRQEIAYNFEEFQHVIRAADFQQFFGNLEGEKLKKVPADYAADHPAIEFLKMKSFLAMHRVSDAAVMQPDFLEHCTSVFRALHPFNQFLNRSTD